MREIKFRYMAQHEETGRFTIKTFTLEEIERGDVFSWYRELGMRWVHLEDKYQYTGLKDKNGKEIYEGDIVEWSIFPDSGGAVKVVDTVVFGKSGCWAVERRTELLFTKEPHRKLEVIGNIYENPELLSTDKHEK